MFFLADSTSFTDSFWYFLSFTSTKSNATVTVTNYNKRCKTQTTSTFNNFSNTVDSNYAFFEFFYFIIFLCHFSVLPLSLEFQVRFHELSLSQSLHTSVIEISTAVKDHFRNTSSYCAFSNCSLPTALACSVLVPFLYQR
jgi:hypothetical protein